MKLTMFYLPTCPHCILARGFLDELRRKNPEYAKIELELIDEDKNKALAESYDYWYVPCFYLGKAKLHEGHAEREDVRGVLDAALKAGESGQIA